MFKNAEASINAAERFGSHEWKGTRFLLNCASSGKLKMWSASTKCKGVYGFGACIKKLQQKWLSINNKCSIRGSPRTVLSQCDNKNKINNPTLPPLLWNTEITGDPKGFGQPKMQWLRLSLGIKDKLGHVDFSLLIKCEFLWRELWRVITYCSSNDYSNRLAKAFVT